MSERSEGKVTLAVELVLQVQLVLELLVQVERRLLDMAFSTIHIRVLKVHVHGGLSIGQASCSSGLTTAAAMAKAAGRGASDPCSDHGCVGEGVLGFFGVDGVAAEGDDSAVRIDGLSFDNTTHPNSAEQSRFPREPLRNPPRLSALQGCVHHL